MVNVHYFILPDGKILSFKNKLFFNNTQLISKNETKLVDYYNILGHKTFSSSSAGQITTLPSYINTMYIISLQVDAQVISSNTVSLYFTDINKYQITFYTNKPSIIMYYVNNMWCILSHVDNKNISVQFFTPDNFVDLYLVTPHSSSSILCSWYIYGINIIKWQDD